MNRIGILGTGTMGAGIAQVAATHGANVELLDVSPEVVARAIVEIGKRLERAVEKGQLTPADRDSARDRLHAAVGPEALAACDLVIEAVSEDLEIKAKVLQPIAEKAPPSTVFASNTSSLSITRIGQALGRGPRMVGMHFFNPPAQMPLVEVIAGGDTDPAAVDQVAALATSWGKTVVRAKDTPGFIVNRVARGFYLEALRMFGEGVAGVAEIDDTMKRLGTFRLGPFELMDLIGIDVNYSVSCSVWEQLGRPARLTPHPIQAELFNRGQLGRKSKRGFYDHAAEKPVPAVTVKRLPLSLDDDLRTEVAAVVARAADKPGTDVENYVFTRILATIINEAALALDEGVATRADIDTAMRLGTNYPRGPLEWAEQIGLPQCGRMLTVLNATAADNRFRPAALLQT